jgi:hypothetical protein
MPTKHIGGASQAIDLLEKRRRSTRRPHEPPLLDRRTHRRRPRDSEVRVVHRNEAAKPFAMISTYLQGDRPGWTAAPRPPSRCTLRRLAGGAPEKVGTTRYRYRGTIIQPCPGARAPLSVSSRFTRWS